MYRRGVLTGLGVAGLAGCLGIGGPRFEGPTEEDPDVVDIRYRTYTPDEIQSIKSEAAEIPYDDLLANIESLVGAPIAFRGFIITIQDNDDHVVYRIAVPGDPDRLQWVFASWTGARFEEAASVSCWGEVLGPEVFTEGMGRELTVPAIAIADMDLIEE